jgi:hypothetical protein
LFKAKVFAKYINPDVPDDSHDVEVSFSKAYFNSIAEIVSWLESLTGLLLAISSIQKQPSASIRRRTALDPLAKTLTPFYSDVREETKILIRIVDIVGEMGIIRWTLLSQSYDILQVPTSRIWRRKC